MERDDARHALRADARQLIGKVLRRGAILEAAGGQLRVQAAPGALDAEARRALQDLKPEILALLGGAKLAVASYAQRRMWFLSGLDPRSPVYNIPLLVHLRGPCRPASLARAVREVWRRHEPLRTRLEVWGEGPVQVVDPRPGDPAIVDLSGIRHPRRRAEQLERHLQDLATRPFDLAAGPLVRAALFRLAAEDHRLLLALHHAVADGWSVNVMLHELGLLYGAFAAGRAPALPPIRYHYADYALWEVARHDRGELEEALRFWSRRLGGLTSRLDLPLDRPPPPVPSQRGGWVAVELPAGAVRGLQQLAREESVTAFIVVLAAYQALLWRLSGQESFNLGTPLASRPRPEVKELIGLFVNTLVVPADCSEEPSLRQLVRRVKAALMAGLDHGEVPFDLVVERLGAAREGRNPLFSVLFSLKPPPAAGPEWAPLGVESTVLPTATAKVDLTLDLEHRGEALAGHFEFDSDLLDRATVMRFAEALTAIVDRGVAAPDLPLSEAPLLAAARRHQTLVEWNGLSPAPPRTGETVLDLVLARAVEAPDRLAVAAGEDAVTFGELERTAEGWAQYLRSLGVGPESIVALLLPRSAALVAAGLAAFKAGAAYLPFEPDTPARRIELMLEDAGACRLLTLRRFSDRVPAHRLERTLFLDEATGQPPPEAAATSRPGAAHLAYVIYTSGSTGRPKAVGVPHRGLLGLVLWARRRYGLAPDDRATLLASPAFDASVWETWPPLASGASLHAADDDTLAAPPRLARWLAERRISVSFVPTPVAELLLAEPAAAELPLRMLGTGGDRLRRRPAGIPVTVTNLYGPTEVSVVATGGAVAHDGHRLPSIGRPISGVRAFVVDRRLRTVAVGVAGELCLGGAAVARGYLAHPGLTAERFVPDGWSRGDGGRVYRTGDRARWLPDGRLDFLGRLDQQVKIRGHRVEPGEVESVLGGHPAVHQAVVQVDRGETGPRLLAYVTARGPDPPPEDELRAYLAERMPAAMVPARIFPLPSLPLTPRGKVDRSRLPAPGEAAGGSAKIPPRTPKEKVLAIIWSRILGIDDIGAFDDFFALGGTSLQMMQVISKVRETFDVDLPPSLLYRTPTLASVAEFIRRSQRSPLLEAGVSISGQTAPESPIVLLRSGELHPLVCVHSVGGHLVEYLELATELAGYGHAVYGVQALQPAAGGSHPDRIEDLARGHVRALVEACSEGPYRLLGYCAGGLIALEMAQQIVRAGGAVDLLAMVEPPLPPLGPTDERRLAADDTEAALLFAGELKIQITRDELDGRARGPSEVPDVLWAAFETQSPEEAGRLDPVTFRRLLAVYSANVRAERRYVATTSPVPLALFEAELHRTTPSALPAWSRLSPERIDHRTIPGNHLTCLRTPHVRTLAESLHRRFTALDQNRLTAERASHLTA